MKTLLVTENMRERMKSNKAIGTLTLDPYDFLALTVSSTPMRWVESESTETIDQYNAWVRDGTIKIMPFLEVDMDTGKVKAHEGRHRAAALLKERGLDMEVAIFLRKNGHLEYYTEPHIDDYDHPKRFAKVYLGVNEVPNAFYGQFSSSRVSIYKRNFKNFYNTLLAKALGRLSWQSFT